MAEFTGHTPGPWTRGSGGATHANRVYGADGSEIAEVNIRAMRRGGYGYFSKNLRLIAAAPDLLARAEAAEARVAVLQGALRSFVSVTGRMKEKGVEINWQNVAEAIIEESQDVLDRADLATAQGEVEQLKAGLKQAIDTIVPIRPSTIREQAEQALVVLRAALKGDPLPPLYTPSFDPPATADPPPADYREGQVFIHREHGLVRYRHHTNYHKGSCIVGRLPFSDEGIQADHADLSPIPPHEGCVVLFPQYGKFGVLARADDVMPHEWEVSGIGCCSEYMFTVMHPAAGWTPQEVG